MIHLTVSNIILHIFSDENEWADGKNAFLHFIAAASYAQY